MSVEGTEVTRRRERLGLDMYELADEAEINRETVSAIEKGKGFRRASLAAIENALDRLEAEAGLTAPPRAQAEQHDGTPVTRRRERLGLDIGELATEASVNRDTVSAIERGKGYRRSSLAAIENALDRLETDAGLVAPPRAQAPHLVEHRCLSTAVRVVRVKNDLGEVVLEGAPEDRLELMADAEAMLLALARVARKVREEANR